MEDVIRNFYLGSNYKTVLVVCFSSVILILLIGVFPQFCCSLAGKDYSQTFCNLNPAETKLFPAQRGIRTSPLVSTTQRNPPAGKRSMSF